MGKRKISYVLRNEFKMHLISSPERRIFSILREKEKKKWGQGEIQEESHKNREFRDPFVKLYVHIDVKGINVI